MGHAPPTTTHTHWRCPLQVQTNGKKTPIQTVQNALQDLGDEVQDIRTKFQQELTRLEAGGGGGGGGGPQY